MKAKFVIWLCLIGSLVLALTGCSQKTIAPSIVPVHDTLWRERLEVDTVYTDRWHTIDRKGDTVWLVDSVVVYRARYLRDTVRVTQEVPVEVVRTETVEVEKKLSLWQRWCLGIGRVAMLVLVGWLVYKGVELWRRKYK